MNADECLASVVALSLDGDLVLHAGVEGLNVKELPAANILGMRRDIVYLRAKVHAVRKRGVPLDHHVVIVVPGGSVEVEHGSVGRQGDHTVGGSVVGKPPRVHVATSIAAFDVFSHGHVARAGDIRIEVAVTLLVNEALISPVPKLLESWTAVSIEQWFCDLRPGDCTHGRDYALHSEVSAALVTDRHTKAYIAVGEGVHTVKVSDVPIRR